MDYATINRKQREAETDSFTARRYAQFASHLEDGPLRVLDVGSSTGRGGEELRRHLPEVELWALDCVSERLDRIDRAVYRSVLCAEAMSIPVADGFVDAIIAGEFIEHLTPEDAAASLREFYRVLRSGGSVLLTTPNPRYVRLLVPGRTVTGGAHLSEWTPGSLIGLLQASGFRKEFVEGTGRVSSILGRHLPDRVYGSYMIGAVRS